MNERNRCRAKFRGRSLRRALCGATANVLLIVMLQPVTAMASCSFTSDSDVGFGTYNAFDILPNASGVGSISIRCQGGGGYAYDVSLSAGQSHSFVSRLMKSGANSLNYNIFTSASRTVVWGDGTGGSSTQTAYKNSTTTLSLFGQIPAGQDVAIGTYTDNLIATVKF